MAAMKTLSNISTRYVSITHLDVESPSPWQSLIPNAVKANAKDPALSLVGLLFLLDQDEK